MTSREFSDVTGSLVQLVHIAQAATDASANAISEIYYTWAILCLLYNVISVRSVEMLLYTVFNYNKLRKIKNAHSALTVT